MTTLLIHANSRELLDTVANMVRSMTYGEYVQQRASGKFPIPPDVRVRMAEKTPKEIYDEFYWLERVEYPNWNEKITTPRRIYTTDPDHPLINTFGQGRDIMRQFIEMAPVHAVYLVDEQVSSIWIIDNLGKMKLCNDFIIFQRNSAGDGYDILAESPGWWKIYPPFDPGYKIYFTKDVSTSTAPILVEVKSCDFRHGFDQYFNGFWEVKASHLTKVEGLDVEIKIQAAYWMFQHTPEISTEEGYCYQVVQLWHTLEMGCTSTNVDDMPCFLNQEDARAFLDAAAFPGYVTRNLMVRNLNTKEVNEVVYEKETGEFDPEKGILLSLDLIEKTKLDVRKLVPPMQWFQPLLTKTCKEGYQVFI